MCLLCCGISRKPRRMLFPILRGQAPPLRLASLRISSPRTIRRTAIFPHVRPPNATPLKPFHSSARRWERRTTYTRFGGNRSPYLGSHMFTKYLSDRSLIMIIGVVSGVSGEDERGKACEIVTQMQIQEFIIYIISKRYLRVGAGDL